MISVELKSLEDFDKLHLVEDDVFLDLLREKFPVEYVHVLRELQDLCCSDRIYSEDELREIFCVDEFVEVFEDLYFETGCEREVIEYYFVMDSVGTDKGTWDYVCARGYVLLC